MNFFEEKSGRLMTYIGAGIVTSSDEYTRKEKPVGFLFLVKEISEVDLRNLEKQIGSVNAYLFFDVSKKDDFIKNCQHEYIVKEIRGYEKNISAYFCLTYTNPIEKQLNKSLLVILIVGGEVLLILLNIFLFFIGILFIDSDN